MLIGELLIQDSSAVYTIPIPRLSANVTFYVNVLQRGGGTAPTINIDIEHRDSIDDSWTTAASFSAITSTGTASKQATGVKELVRLKTTLSSGSVGDSFARIAYLMPPVWS